MVDRLRRRPLLIGCQVVLALVVAVLPLLASRLWSMAESAAERDLERQPDEGPHTQPPAPSAATVWRMARFQAVPQGTDSG